MIVPVEFGQERITCPPSPITHGLDNRRIHFQVQTTFAVRMTDLDNAVAVSGNRHLYVIAPILHNVQNRPHKAKNAMTFKVIPSRQQSSAVTFWQSYILGLRVVIRMGRL